MTGFSPVVEALELTKTYTRGVGRVEAVRGVSFAVEAGEFVGITGPSGSGKSTILSIIGCLDRPTSGRCRFAGKDVSQLTDRELSSIRSSDIGFVFQTFNLVSHYSVAENVAMPFLYCSRPVRDARKRTLDAIERVGLSDRLKHRPSELSGGEMQRVAIARALAAEPLLLLADEPTGNLDSVTGQGILDMLQQLNQDGVTVVVVTHDRDMVSSCGRVLSVQDGRIVS